MKDKNKADITIDKKVKDRTRKCEKDFNCLSPSYHELCEVNETVKDEVFFIECQEEKHCVYAVSFGIYKTCNCPTRKEIYRKYKI